MVSNAGRRTLDPARPWTWQRRRPIAIRRMLRISAMALMLILSLAGVAGMARGAGSDRSTSGAFRLSDGSTIQDAYSTIVRNQAGVGMTFHTLGLIAGDAYTVWWIVFNNPDMCAPGHRFRCAVSDLTNPATGSSVLYAAGHVIGGEGVGNFGSYLNVGDTSGAIMGNGLTNPMGADVHLVVRDHGPMIPDLVADQISSFGGACDVNVCANVQASVHQ